MHLSQDSKSSPEANARASLSNRANNPGYEDARVRSAPCFSTSDHSLYPKRRAWRGGSNSSASGETSAASDASSTHHRNSRKDLNSLSPPSAVEGSRTQSAFGAYVVKKHSFSIAKPWLHSGAGDKLLSPGGSRSPIASSSSADGLPPPTPLPRSAGVAASGVLSKSGSTKSSKQGYAQTRCSGSSDLDAGYPDLQVRTCPPTTGKKGHALPVLQNAPNAVSHDKVPASPLLGDYSKGANIVCGQSDSSTSNATTKASLGRHVFYQTKFLTGQSSDESGVPDDPDTPLSSGVSKHSSIVRASSGSRFFAALIARRQGEDTQTHLHKGHMTPVFGSSFKAGVGDRS